MFKSIQTGASRLVVPIVFRFGRLGDMVMLTSLLQLLRQRYGSPCELYAAGDWNAALLARHPDVLELSVLGRYTPIGLGASWWRAWWRLLRSGGRPIYVSEVLPRQLRRIRRLFWLAGVRQEQVVFITQVPGDVDAHWLDRLARFGALTPAAFTQVPAAAPPADRAPRPQLHLLPDELTTARAWLAQHAGGARQVILVQPGNYRTLSSRRDELRDRDDKAWPLENWVTLLLRVAEAQPEAVVLVCGAPQESAMIAQIVSAARHERVVSAALPLRPFLALCRLAHSMISIDTGPAHAAAALGVPLTVMYGAESPKKWLPVSGEGSPVLAVGGPPRSRVAALSVDEVFQRWQETLYSPRLNAEKKKSG
jgi:ADP-heptose:LPS heptosyltransferase